MRIRPLRSSRDHQNVKGRTHSRNGARDCRAVIKERCHAKQSPGLRAIDGIEPRRAVPFSDISQDFYNWINLPGVQARLPDNTPQVIKSSPAAVIGQAMIDQETRKASAEERFKRAHADLGEPRQLPDLAQVPPPSTDAAKKFEQRLIEMGTLKLDAPAKTLRLEDQRSVNDGRKSTTEPSKPPGSTDPSL